MSEQTETQGIVELPGPDFHTRALGVAFIALCSELELIGLLDCKTFARKLRMLPAPHCAVTEALLKHIAKLIEESKWSLVRVGPIGQVAEN